MNKEEKRLPCKFFQWKKENKTASEGWHSPTDFNELWVTNSIHKEGISFLTDSKQGRN